MSLIKEIKRLFNPVGFELTSGRTSSSVKMNRKSNGRVDRPFKSSATIFSYLIVCVDNRIM